MGPRSKQLDQERDKLADRMMGNSALISRMKDICVCVRMCVCVCTLNLGSVFTLPFVYHCSVCVAVNIRQQLNLRGWQTSASPTDCSPELDRGEEFETRSTPRRQRCDLNTDP